jgi:hypothetical protein
VAVCLPPALNKFSATEAQRSALQALEAHVFDQRVFQYCSQDVARFLRTAIKAPVGVRACAVPVHCSCTTAGAQLDSDKCHSNCQELACDSKNCPGILRRTSKLDINSCFCSRAEACGVTSPRSDDPVMCRDWLTPTATPLGAIVSSEPPLPLQP